MIRFQAFTINVSAPILHLNIESFFNWLIEKAHIQRAAKVRATKALIAHVFGAIAAALLFWYF
jgi:hypothetical protein